jgi:hypothetical protein
MEMSKNELSLIARIPLRLLSEKRKREKSANLSLFSGEAG